MAALTNRKVVATKGSLAIVTCQATLTASRGVMVEWFRRGYLLPLRHTGANLMTLIAGDFLMFRMTEANSKGLCKTRRA
jgi:hypothetical protein